VTVTLGRAEFGVVCEAAVPQNIEVDRIAMAESATKLDDILTTRSPKSGNKRRPGAERREASLEVSNVSREFPRVSVLKFSMSVRQGDTLRYKIECRVLRTRASSRSESIDRPGIVDREGACGIIHEEGTEYTASRFPLSV
jgi:hypothetical protein